SIDRVIAVKSPSATPAAIGSAARQPCPSAYETTSRTVGPGMTSRIVEAATKASQTSIAIDISVASRPRCAGSLKPQFGPPDTRYGRICVGERKGQTQLQNDFLMPHDEKERRTITALRPFIPAKDFALSNSFYEALGFEPHPLGPQLVEMRLGEHS